MGIAAVLLAFTLTGCSETAEEGPVPFKGTKDPAIDTLRENMSKSVKAGDHTKKPPAETPKTDTKSAADSKAAPEKKKD
jgi:hypothetical protein